ncbi:MAG: hypothetical protein K1Y36_14670 [Blastocatellia bacterium]|nr:hypothetical protein [Blastocatellia bacterium]
MPKGSPVYHTINRLAAPSTGTNFTNVSPRLIQLGFRMGLALVLVALTGGMMLWFQSQTAEADAPPSVLAPLQANTPNIAVFPLTILQGGRKESQVLATVSTSCQLDFPNGIQFNLTVPNGIQVTPTITFNDARTQGQISATVVVSCSIPPGQYQIGTIKATNSTLCGGTLSTQTTAILNVQQNPVPTLGNYDGVSLMVGDTVTVTPSAPPADANNDLKSVAVLPDSLPGGGSIVIDPVTGIITIGTTGSTLTGTTTIQVTATDACGNTATKQFVVSIGAALVNTRPVLAITNGVSVSQGASPLTTNVATTSDDQEPAGNLIVSATDIPTGLTVVMANSGGTIAATVTADCLIRPGTYSVTIRVLDNGIPIAPALDATASFAVNVAANSAPTLGTYQDVNLVTGTNSVVTPTATPKDANNNITSATVTPSQLPGGGTISLNATTGVVTVSTQSSTTPGRYPIRVRLVDLCNVEASAGFNLTVTRPLTRPAAPTNLALAPASTVQLDLSWKDNSDNETGFVIERKIGATGAYAVIATVNADVARFGDSGLTAGVPYFYRVKATNTVGDSDYTNEANGTPPVAVLSTVTQFYPIAAAPGQTIRITGSGFLAGATQVLFGGDRQIVSGGVNVISPSAMDVVVPDSTVSQNINGFLTIRISGAPDITTRALPLKADNPADASATFPEFIRVGDLNGDGEFSALDLTVERAIVLRQTNPSQRQLLAGDLFPLNSNNSRGDSSISGIDVTVLQALLLGQIKF